jgi:protein phosphatase
MRIRWGAATHPGRIRTHNEDAYGIYPDPPASDGESRRGLFVVADGLGGHAGGEIASRLAVDVLGEKFPFPLSDAEKHLEEALRAANDRIRERASKEPELEGMGTTIVAALVQEDRAVIAHVGDSRAYLIRDGKLTQVTRDHTVIEEKLRAGLLSPREAMNHPHRHILSRALGIGDPLKLEKKTLPLHAGDLLLLCTDGLTNMLTDDEILKVVLSSSDVPSIPESLVKAANQRGGIDNITATALQINPE